MEKQATDPNPNVESRKAPYPKSPVITGLTWEPASTIVRMAKGKGKDGSDNWPVTWADDGALYTAYGDGYGFDPRVPEKLGMGFARITGGPKDFATENIRSDGENTGSGRSGKKGSGMLSVGGVLYMWLFHADEQGGQAQLAWSFDHAKTWTFCGWKFEAFGLCAFINFGRDYQGARDGYVYTATHDGPMADGPADRMVLMRVPKDRIQDREAYEFFMEIDGDGQPVWSPDIEKRGAVFEHKDACLRSGISYCAPLKLHRGERRGVLALLQGEGLVRRPLRFGFQVFPHTDLPGSQPRRPNVPQRAARRRGRRRHEHRHQRRHRQRHCVQGRCRKRSGKAVQTRGLPRPKLAGGPHPGVVGRRRSLDMGPGSRHTLLWRPQRVLVRPRAEKAHRLEPGHAALSQPRDRSRRKR